jgi:hypothetical protein
MVSNSPRVGAPRAEKKHDRTGNRVDGRLRSTVAVAFQFQFEKKDTVDDTAGKLQE